MIALDAWAGRPAAGEPGRRAFSLRSVPIGAYATGRWPADDDNVAAVLALRLAANFGQRPLLDRYVVPANKACRPYWSLFRPPRNTEVALWERLGFDPALAGSFSADPDGLRRLFSLGASEVFAGEVGRSALHAGFLAGGGNPPALALFTLDSLRTAHPLEVVCLNPHGEPAAPRFVWREKTAGMHWFRRELTGSSPQPDPALCLSTLRTELWALGFDPGLANLLPGYAQA